MGEYQTVEGLLLSLGFDVANLEAERQGVLAAMDVFTYNLNGAVSLETAWNHYHDAARSQLAVHLPDEPLRAKAIRHIMAATAWHDGGDYHRYQRSLVRATTIAAEANLSLLVWQLDGFINAVLKPGLELELSGSYERALLAYERALNNSDNELHDLGWLLYAYAFCLRQSAINLTARDGDSLRVATQRRQMLIIASRRLRAATMAFTGCDPADQAAGQNTVSRLRHDLAELFDDHPNH